MKSLYLFLALVMVSLLGLLGCHQRIVDLPVPVGIESVEITLLDSTTTLRIRPGEASVHPGFVMVWTSEHQPASGWVVSLTNVDSTLAFIDLADTSGRTNSEGRLNFHYHARGLSGRDTLCARIGTIRGCLPLVLDTTGTLQ